MIHHRHIHWRCTRHGATWQAATGVVIVATSKGRRVDVDVVDVESRCPVFRLELKWSPTYRLGDRLCPTQRVLRVRPTIFWWTSLCDEADDELFNKAVRLSNHLLHALLPPPSSASQRYNLRNRTHLLQLPDHTTHLSDKNFITHMLYKNT